MSSDPLDDKTALRTAYEACYWCHGSGLPDGMYGPVGCDVCHGDCMIRIRDERGRFRTKLVIS